MTRTVRLRLPSAPAPVYRAWMSYWRRAEERILADPDTGGEHDPPFTPDPVADYLSAEVVPEIIRQASAAGQGLVAPELEADPQRVMDGVEYIARQARWLSPRAHAALRIEPPSEEVEELRARVLVTLRVELGRILRPS